MLERLVKLNHDPVGLERCCLEYGGKERYGIRNMAWDIVASLIFGLLSTYRLSPRRLYIRAFGTCADIMHLSMHQRTCRDERMLFVQHVALVHGCRASPAPRNAHP